MTSSDERWYFTKEQLANTPSRRSGLDPDKELSQRQQAANFIQDMGQRLQVTQLCINTAIVYMHRFYVFHSFTHFHRNALSTAALFLAAKVEEQPRKLEHIIKVAQLCLQKSQTLPERRSDFYTEQAQELVMNENILLQTLGFDVAIDHPHTHVVRCCHLVGASKDLSQTSYFMASNSLHLTTMCLQYRPTVVACFCIHLACKWSNWEIPVSSEGKAWFLYVDTNVTQELLEQLTEEFLIIFDKCPSRLKKRIMLLSNNSQNSASLASYPFDADCRNKALQQQHQRKHSQPDEPGPNTMRDSSVDLKKSNPVTFVPKAVVNTPVTCVITTNNPLPTTCSLINPVIHKPSTVLSNSTSVTNIHLNIPPTSSTSSAIKTTVPQKVNNVSSIPGIKSKTSHNVSRMAPNNTDNVEQSKSIINVKQEPFSIPPVSTAQNSFKKDKPILLDHGNNRFISTSHSDIISNVVKEVAMAKQNEKLLIKSEPFDNDKHDLSLSLPIKGQSGKTHSIFSPPPVTASNSNSSIGLLSPKHEPNMSPESREKQNSNYYNSVPNGGSALIPVVKKLEMNGDFDNVQATDDISDNIPSSSSKKKKKHKEKDKYHDREKKHKDKKKHKEDRHHHRHRHHHKEPEGIKIKIPKEKLIDIPNMPKEKLIIKINKDQILPPIADFKLKISKDYIKKSRKRNHSHISDEDDHSNYTNHNGPLSKKMHSFSNSLGKGLGKNENGIKKCLKPNLKFDTTGIGYDKKQRYEESHKWWEELYNKTASNVSSKTSNLNLEDKCEEFKPLTDEELFKACSGRTAHKGARHGHNLSGKLKRLQRQENEFQNMKNSNISGKCDSNSLLDTVDPNENFDKHKKKKIKKK